MSNDNLETWTQGFSPDLAQEERFFEVVKRSVAAAKSYVKQIEKNTGELGESDLDVGRAGGNEAFEETKLLFHHVTVATDMDFAKEIVWGVYFVAMIKGCHKPRRIRATSDFKEGIMEHDLKANPHTHHGPISEDCATELSKLENLKRGPKAAVDLAIWSGALAKNAEVCKDRVAGEQKLPWCLRMRRDRRVDLALTLKAHPDRESNELFYTIVTKDGLIRVDPRTSDILLVPGQQIREESPSSEY